MLGVIGGMYTSVSLFAPRTDYLIISCRPRWLPREISVVIVTAVYIPPQADMDLALGKLYEAVNKQETARPEAACIVVGDFNKANFRKVVPKFVQNVSCSTRGSCTLDHCYTPFRNAYKARPDLRSPTAGQSDSMLQDCFDHVDWEMFREALMSTQTLTGFIRKCIEDVVPTKPVRVYPNQKPWLNCEVRAALNARTAAFKSGHTEEYKKASYALRTTIRAAKREYRAKVESQFNTTNTRSLRQGLNTVTDFRRETPSVDNISAALPDELNTFSARFEVNHIVLPERAPATADSAPHSVSVVTRAKLLSVSTSARHQDRMAYLDESLKYVHIT
ncbi:hypothetical protein NFI96_017648 [Prochilodus magdalenae]|nr:hypothetical protein NFI96_017648 [Prochilodus magdalenae]